MRMSRERVVVVLEYKVYVYNFADLNLLHTIETASNPRGNSNPHLNPTPNPNPTPAPTPNPTPNPTLTLTRCRFHSRPTCCSRPSGTWSTRRSSTPTPKPSPYPHPNTNTNTNPSP